MPTSPKFTVRQWGAYVLLCAIWGSTWLAIRVAVHDLPPISTAAVRFLLAAIVLAVFVIVRGYSWPKSKAEWIPQIVLSVSMMAVPFGLLFWAEQYVMAGMAAVLYATIPIMVAIFNPMVGGQIPDRRTMFSMLIAIGAVGYIFQSQFSTSRMTLIGGAAIMVAAVCCAFSAIYAKRHHVVHPVVSTCVQLVLGGVLLFGVARFVEPGSRWNWSKPAIIALAYMVILGSAVAFAVYYWLLRQVEAWQASSTSLIVPLVAIYLDASLAQEHVPWDVVAASVLVIASVGVVLRPEPSDPIALELESMMQDEPISREEIR
jgi:drug/metabolite transporter (DMT)-like permease